MKIVKVIVDGQIRIDSIYDTDNKTSVSVDTKLKIPAGNYKNIVLDFDFISPKASQTGLHLFAIFKADRLNNPIEVEIKQLQAEGNTYNYACFVPAEVLQEIGQVSFGIYGYILNEDGSLKKRLSLNPESHSVVAGSYDENALDETVPTPSVFEVYFDKIKTMEAELEAFEERLEATVEDQNLIKRLRIKGNSTQETRSGKNLLNNTLVDETKTGITLKVNEDKSIALSGTATEDTPFYFMTQNNPMLLKAGTYTLSGNSSNSSTIRLLLYTKDWKPLGSNLSGGTTFTLEEDTEVFVYVWIASGTTVNLTMYPMIEPGNTKTEYEPYGASPSPEFPSEIENVSGSVEIKNVNKNLTDVPEDFIFTQYKAVSVNLPTGTYKVNCKSIFVNDEETYGRAYVRMYPNSTGFYIKKEQTITLDKDCTELRFYSNGYSQSGSTGYTAAINQFMISKDGGEYKPHESQAITFPLSEGQKLYKDSSLEVDGIHHKRTQVVLDGTEAWYQYGSNVALREWDNYLTPEHKDTDLPGYMCNIATESVSSQTENNNTFATYHSGDADWVVFNINILVDDWKSYLAEQHANGTPVIVECELAEEVVVPYTAEQVEALNQMYNAYAQGLTNLSFSSEAEPIVEFLRETKEIVHTEDDNTIRSLIQKVNSLEAVIASLQSAAATTGEDA